MPSQLRDRIRLVVALAGCAAILPAAVLADPCVQPDASGTVNMPPQGCPYVSPTDFHHIVDGLPPGTTVNVGVEHQKFFNVTRQQGGSLGGEIERFNSIGLLHMQGTGDLSSYSRLVSMQLLCETHTAPRGTGPIQSFDTDMFMMQGQLPPGDPDFDLLRITAGTNFGMPSPGHTTLIQQGSNWNVDSFFDIEYRIDFTGAPGGPFAGRSGSTTATIRMQAGERPVAVEQQPWGSVKRQYQR